MAPSLHKDLESTQLPSPPWCRPPKHPFRGKASAKDLLQSSYNQWSGHPRLYDHVQSVLVGLTEGAAGLLSIGTYANWKCSGSVVRRVWQNTGEISGSQIHFASTMLPCRLAPSFWNNGVWTLWWRHSKAGCTVGRLVRPDVSARGPGGLCRSIAFTL